MSDFRLYVVFITLPDGTRRYFKGHRTPAIKSFRGRVKASQIGVCRGQAEGLRGMYSDLNAQIEPRDAVEA
jgi:hypothetical protein